MPFKHAVISGAIQGRARTGEDGEREREKKGRRRKRGEEGSLGVVCVRE